MRECGELVQYGSWAGACDNEIACSVLACVSVYRWVRVRESVPQYGPRPPGLCTSVYVCTVRTPKGFLKCCWCSPHRALYFCILQCGARPNGLCVVRVYKGFVLRCTVRAPRALCGASLQKCFTVCARACASVYCTSPKIFARCEPTKALCFCVPYERQELCAVRAYKGFVPLCAVRVPRAFFGVSLQRLYTVCARACASVYCTSLTSFVRCEPTKALYSVYCTSLTSFVRCEPTKALDSVHCTSLTSFVRCEPTMALYSVLVFALQALRRVLMCPCGRMNR